MSWRVAPCLDVLRDEFNAACPGRDKASDGAIGDQAHAARHSDHNPDGNGVVRARDYDENLSGHDGENAVDDRMMARCAEHIRKLGAEGDVRLNGGPGYTKQNGYVIYEGRIAGAGKGWAWRTYTGPNAHAHHMHVSCCGNPAGYSNRGSWGIADLIADKEPAEPSRLEEDEDMPLKFMLTPDGTGIIVFPWNDKTKAAGDHGKLIRTPAEFDALVARGWVTAYNPKNDQERMDQPTFDFLTRGAP